MEGLAGILLSLGGPVLAHALGRRFGGEIGDLAQDALNALGQAFGVEPKEDKVTEAIEHARQAGPGQAEARIKVAEADMAKVFLAQAELQRAGNEQQKMTNELLQATAGDGGWFASAWLYVWQWVLMAFWAWAILIAPVCNAALRIFATQTSTDLITGQLTVAAPAVATVDMTVLLTLTGLYLGLHMGGHTVLELMRGRFGGMFDGKGDKGSDA